MNVTNHAVIRLAHRHLGYVFEEGLDDDQKFEILTQAGVAETIRGLVLTPYIKSQIKKFKPKSKCRLPDKDGGYAVIIENGRNVVTVV